jgi:hypothetical protein
VDLILREIHVSEDKMASGWLHSTVSYAPTLQVD